MLEALRNISATLGSDPLLVQAAGGNTSLKRDGIMWIKASGTWLRDALAKDIFVPLDIAALHAALERDDPACEACVPFVRQDINPSGLRPSIETSVHGLMAHPVVLHVHCVNTIAWAVQRDAKDLLAPLLAPFNWAYVPYARPGLQLCRAIRRVIAPTTEVLILQNHGLAVGGATVAEAEALLRRVVRVLQRPVRSSPSPDVAFLAGIAKGTAYRLPTEETSHGFALDAWSHAHAANRCHYPDHVLFLGARIPADPATGAPALAIVGKGVLVHESARAAVEPMLGCLSHVFARLDPSVRLTALSDEDNDQLLNWDAEKYRLALNTTTS